MTYRKPLVLLSIVGCFLTLAPAWGSLFAQATPPVVAAPVTGGDIVTTIVESAIKTLGPIGILGWYLYYSASKILPTKDKQIVDAQAISAKLLSDAQTQFSSSLQLSIKAFTDEATAIRDNRDKQADTDRATFQTSIERMTNMVMQVVGKCPGVQMHEINLNEQR